MANLTPPNLHLETFVIVIGVKNIKAFGQYINTMNKKSRVQRVPLLKTSSRMKESMPCTINDYRILVDTHNSPNHINEPFSKIKSSQNQVNERPRYSIIGLGHI